MILGSYPSSGLELAKLAALPEDVTNRARFVATKLSELEDKGPFSRPL